MKVAPTLRRFQTDDSFVRFILGPVGSGKSSASVVEIPRRAGLQAKGPDGVRRSRFLVIRNTYSQLRDTTRKTFEQWIPPEAGSWHEQSFTWVGRWRESDASPKADVECEVLFRALDRPEDVKKLLSLELTGAYINEAREIPKHVLDILETRVGRYPSKVQGGCSWFGIWGDSNPWHSGHWGAKLFAKKLPGYKLFRQPGGRALDAENIDNLPAGYYERLCQGKDREWIRVYVDGEDAAGDVGSVWGSWIDGLEKRGGICDFAHPRDGVFTTWDLGRADSTAIWFWRLNDKGLPDILDHYENAGPGLTHYLKEVDERGYKYVKHWFPHDARAKTLVTDLSVIEQAAEHWGEDAVAIGPQLSVADGIAAARWLLEQPIRIHARCTEPGRMEYSGVDALREYRFEWDEKNQCFSNKPLHNWASHTADSFRGTALVFKHSELMTRKPPKRPDGPYASPIDGTFTLEQLFEDRERELDRRRR